MKFPLQFRKFGCQKQNVFSVRSDLHYPPVGCSRYASFFVRHESKVPSYHLEFLKGIVVETRVLGSSDFPRVAQVFGGCGVGDRIEILPVKRRLPQRRQIHQRPIDLGGIQVNFTKNVPKLVPTRTTLGAKMKRP